MILSWFITTLYALREDHVRAPLSQKKSSASPPPPPKAINNDRSLNGVEMRKFRCIYFQARIQVVAFLLNYEQTVFYSVILDSQNTFYLLLTFTLHLLLLDMLLPAFFRRVLRACVVLFPLLGVTWVFGVLSVTDLTGMVFQYLFTICNSLQVIFGFWPCLNLY